MPGQIHRACGIGPGEVVQQMRVPGSANLGQGVTRLCQAGLLLGFEPAMYPLPKSAYAGGETSVL